MTLSNSQITKLGDRLRDSELSENDLTMLDEFRQTFSDVDEQAYKIIRDTLVKFDDLTITKRKRKTQQSIVEKLKRQPKLRLPQMQDIAGCRIVIEGGTQRAQNVNSVLEKAFEQQQWQIESKDRDEHGYHAIHIIVKMDAKFYEIQLRTYAQDVWANLVESLSDEKNTLKYGGSVQEQGVMTQLKTLADEFSKIDKLAHEATFTAYQQHIEEAIRHVLSH
ncbi:MAG: hypothetical protein P1U57_00960 [Oleibacter sp.]|nr:hypothetical protein [Thalassolituus sp.]